MENSTKNNFILQTFYQVLILGIPLILSPYLTRVLGSESLGTYSYCHSIATYFSIFIMLGIQTHGCRKIAACKNSEEERKMFFSLFFLHLIGSVVVVCLYAMFACTFGARYFSIYLILGLFLLSSVFDITWYYYGKENFKYVVLVNTVVKIAETALIFIFVKNSDGLLLYILIVCSALVVGQAILLFPILFKHKFYKPSFDEIKSHLKPLLFLTVSVVAINVYTMLDKTLVGIFVNDHNASVAFYDYSEKIAKLPITIMNVLGTVLLPKMSNLYAKGNKEMMKKTIVQANFFLSFLSCGACFGLMAISRIIMPMYYGEEFAICGSYLMYLCPLIVIIPFGATVRNAYLIPCGRDREYLISLVSGALINLVLNLILIPNIGVIGAIIGTIASEVVALVLQLTFARKDLPVGKFFVELIPFVGFSMLMFVMIVFINNFLEESVTTVLIDILVGGAFYVLASAAYTYFTHKDIFDTLLKRRTRHEDYSNSANETK